MWLSWLLLVGRGLDVAVLAFVVGFSLAFRWLFGWLFVGFFGFLAFRWLLPHA
jgi:hypothetical protein